MELPGLGVKTGQWDLRPNIGQYLGDVDFRDRRVLEIGTANGFVCFELERRGARVVGFDLAEELTYDAPPHSPDYVDLTGTYPHDIEAAKKLLAEAGYPNGFEVTLKAPPVFYATLGGQIIASELAKVGIKVNLVNLADFNQWISEVFINHDFDLTIVSHVEPNDIGIYADPNYYFGYNDPDFQAIIKTLNETTDPAARRELLIAAQKRLAEQAVNGYLFELPQIGVYNAKLEGMWPNQPVEGVVITGVHWTE